MICVSRYVATIAKRVSGYYAKRAACFFHLGEHRESASDCDRALELLELGAGNPVLPKAPYQNPLDADVEEIRTRGKKSVEISPEEAQKAFRTPISI